MGEVFAFEKEKLVIGVMFTEQKDLDRATEALTARFGEVDMSSPVYSFSAFSPYYEEEMQGEVFRRFLSFKDCVAPDTLADIKLLTNDMERELSPFGGRKVNLDPALINIGRMTFATTKDAAHRIPLEKGIYAEMTLLFAKHDWHAFGWTYMDMKSETVRKFLVEVHAVYLEQRKAGLC